MIGFLLAGIALFVALHLILPAPRDASMEMGTSVVIVMAGLVGMVRGWATRKSNRANLVAMILIVAYGLQCFGLGIVRPRQLIPWFLNPAMVAVVLLLITALWRAATTRRRS